MVGKECLRCSEPEMRDYKIRFEKDRQTNFANELGSEKIKNKSKEVDISNIFDIIEEILRYLEKDDLEDCKMNHEFLFRGFAMKV